MASGTGKPTRTVQHEATLPKTQRGRGSFRACQACQATSEGSGGTLTVPTHLCPLSESGPAGYRGPVYPGLKLHCSRRSIGNTCRALTDACCTVHTYNSLGATQP